MPPHRISAISLVLRVGLAMIIYGENLASTGFTPANLAKGGNAYDQWPVIEKGLVERAGKQVIVKK